MPKFSIIIPLYNAEPHIAQCLDSIAQQTYTDFEVIMVDDGSTDNSAAICTEMQRHDSRFFYIYQENGGVSSARNVGIAKATGEWLCFVDADDVLYPATLSTYYNMVSRQDADMAMGSYVLDSNIPKECFKEEKSFLLTIDRHKAADLMFLTNEYGYQGYVWNKVFKRSIIQKHGICFDTSISYNEDRLFCIDYICHMNGPLLFSSTPVYHYFKRETGAMGKASKAFNEKIFSDFDSSVLMLTMLKENGFPRKTINLSRDRIADSYDLIRHNMRNVGCLNAKQRTAELLCRVKRIIGQLFYIDNRIRRFLSKQLGHILKRKIYLESVL